MPRKSPNQLHWESIERQQLVDEYNRFLQENGYENNPDNANLFVIRKGMVGMKARDTIEALAGGLPAFYD
ncbi:MULTISPECIES: hypothetical protein [Serratia]|jgi:hypothetical protein|uniref:hypothetical protein n=1 Tax=Serratia TaxID=613 RepID=UPI00124CFAF1|nr:MULTISPECIES: hypothetical protein [Serratia]QFH60917.1 hypothetical protein FR888_17325 [Serratia marcescens]QFH60969.1 hypothetical protein FR888_17625 [Serratia marcescens]QFH61021.1 hypothetical protein FR888_17925 [Serratia marcescens]CAI1987943.1 Uncharacterised protein [Serratia proteamaculans]